MPGTTPSAKPRQVVVGGGLAGIAAAARLAKLGHPVTLLEESGGLGGRYRAVEPEPGVVVDAFAQVLLLPAPWRDLFRKSGRPMDAELTRHGLALVEAPPARHRFGDGSELELPAERGAQEAALTAAYGRAAAHRWRDLVDGLVEVWQALRPLGLEAPWSPPDRGARRAIRAGSTVADLAAGIGEPHLAELIAQTAWREGSDPARTPAWRAARLAVERTFGRWQLVDGDGVPQPVSRLLAVLTDRLRTRRVDVRTGTAVSSLTRDGESLLVHTGTEPLAAPAVIATVHPWTLHRLAPGALPLRGLQPAPAPRLSHSVIEGDHTTAVRETIEHPERRVHYDRRLPDHRILRITHDHAAGHPDPAFGPAWTGRWPLRQWRRLPGLRSAVPGLLLAGPWQPGGLQPEQQLLSGALAVAAVSDAG